MSLFRCYCSFFAWLKRFHCSVIASYCYESFHNASRTNCLDKVSSRRNQWFRFELNSERLWVRQSKGSYRTPLKPLLALQRVCHLSLFPGSLLNSQSNWSLCSRELATALLLFRNTWKTAQLETKKSSSCKILQLLLKRIFTPHSTQARCSIYYNNGVVESGESLLCSRHYRWDYTAATASDSKNRRIPPVSFQGPIPTPRFQPVGLEFRTVDDEVSTIHLGSNNFLRILNSIISIRTQ
jgi:hypothetical protein